MDNQKKVVLQRKKDGMYFSGWKRPCEASHTRDKTKAESYREMDGQVEKTCNMLQVCSASGRDEYGPVPL